MSGAKKNQRLKGCTCGVLETPLGIFTYADPGNSGGGPEKVINSLSYFTEIHTDLPLEAIGPLGPISS